MIKFVIYHFTFILSLQFHWLFGLQQSPLFSSFYKIFCGNVYLIVPCRVNRMSLTFALSDLCPMMCVLQDYTDHVAEIGNKLVSIMDGMLDMTLAKVMHLL